MNEILQSKLNELENAQDYECWYIVKQTTDFSTLCYLVSNLIEYQKNRDSKTLQEYIKERNNSCNYRALRVASFLGLIKMTSSKFEDAHITDTFKEIRNRCNGDYKKIELYEDIIQRQIEKTFISSKIDEKYNETRKDYRLYPVMLLYKILLELGRTSGKYSISMTEYRYIVATTKNFKDFLNSLFLIKLLREDNTNAQLQFNKFKDKFDNRYIKLLEQLDTLNIDKNSITLKEDKIEEVAKKIFIFEENYYNLDDDSYIEFLGSTKSLFDIVSNNPNNNSNTLRFKTDYSSEFPHNRILFGAPGTGKSYTLNKESEQLLGKSKNINLERVTFHPDYSYSNFIGTYKPVMIDNVSKKHLSPVEQEIISILIDNTKDAQEKYDLLYSISNNNPNALGISRIPLLLGLYDDEEFQTQKKDGSATIADNNVERNHGRAIRPYVNLIQSNYQQKDISYEYVPGPFMRVLVKALKSAMTENPQPFLLIIEEINRANMASVFGEVFQLLDRDSDGTSEYQITTTNDMRRYLSEQLKVEECEIETIKIPNNMFIWATMNSADQGIFPMDTAFKRRWHFNYLGIDDNDENIKDKYVLLAHDQSQKVNWNKLRKSINNFLANENINEDKQLGPYFISKDIIESKEDELDRDKFIDTFKNKVIMYLFEDAAKQKRNKLFKGCKSTNPRYSDICKEFEKNGIKIFHEDIIEECEVENNI